MLVRASTRAQASAIAQQLSTAAHGSALPPPSLLDARFWARGWEVYPFVPDAPVGFGSFAITQ